MEILFSIIIPVFNSEKYLSNAIRSVLRQKFSKTKYEIIIINDCSTDKSKLIIQKFSKKFKNIKLINNKKNFKVSYCRNIGIQEASGKYIIFLDSDDELKTNTFKKAEKLILKEEYDLILYLEYQSNKSKINREQVRQINNIETFINYDNKNKVYNPNCWNMIINKEFLKKKKIYFKKIDIFEDQVFCTEILLAANKVKILPETFYNYILRPISLSRNTSYLAFKSCTYVLINFFKILNKSNLPENKIDFIKYRINFIISILKIYLNVCSNTQIKKSSTKVQKSLKNLKIRNNSLKKYILKKKEFLISENLLDIKNIFNNKILNKNYDNYDKIFIFGYGILGRTVFHVLKQNKINVDGFVDNNYNFLNAKYFERTIFNLKKFKHLINQKNGKILVIICQNNKKISKSIAQQLLSIKLQRKNITIFKDVF